MTDRPGRLGVGIIGAGRVGAVLGSSLRAVGHAVVGVSATSTASRERAEAMLPQVPVLGVEEIVERSELVLLAVPDDVLGDLVSGLSALKRFQPGQLVVHTAGRYGTQVLQPATTCGAIPLAIHPAMTFTGTSIDLSRLVGAPFAVTAPPPVLPIAQALVVEMGGEPVVLEEGSRGLYHAALAHGANHLVTLTAQAIRLLNAAGIDDGGTMLRPLLTAALDGALREGDNALTGPVARGDAGTLAEHVHTLAALDADGNLADVLRTYLTLARSTTQRALATGRISTSQAQALTDVLEGITGPTTAQPGSGAEPPVKAQPGAGAEPGTTAQSGTTAQPDTTTQPGSGAEPAVASPDRPGGPAGADDQAGPTPSSAPLVLHTAAELRTHQRTLDPAMRRAAVFTMGALHEGHLSLVRTAAALADHVTVTIFVNPLQFDQAADLAAYPNTLEADLAALTEVGGVDLVFAPSAEEMYPDGPPQVRVVAGEAGRRLEGASRPGHFDGMLTVVHKLLSLTRPDITVFGQKDAQQLILVRQMVRDLDMDVQIVSAPTVREADGLALSSRNVHLSDRQRTAALALVTSLRAAIGVAERGGGPQEALRSAREVFDAADADLVELDYLELVDPVTMEPYAAAEGGPGLLVVAARVGSTRLIDNAEITFEDCSEAPA